MLIFIRSTQLLAEQWKSIDADEKKQYETLAAKDKERSQREQDAYNSKKRKKESSDDGDDDDEDEPKTKKRKSKKDD